MHWTLLVPGALLPQRLAPELARALAQTPGATPLVQQLRQVRAAGVQDAVSGPGGAPHWTWLARLHGLTHEPPPTAPYAWQALTALPPDEHWTAWCEPVHMSIARDHFVVNDLGPDPLQPEEARVLEALARAAAQEHALELAVHAGSWFLRARQRWDLHTCALDAVLGRSAQERLPTGADARRWRQLANDIQMRWHASSVNEAREERGARTANALWIHGAGCWEALPPRAPLRFEGEAGSRESLVLAGWSTARQGTRAVAGTAATDRAAPGAGTEHLALHRGLLAAHSQQAWDSWLGAWQDLGQRLERELALARQEGARSFALVLGGERQVRSLALPLHPGWWQRLWAHRAAAPALLEHWLREPEEAAPAQAPAGGRA